jgi:hypothetical protein
MEAMKVTKVDNQCEPGCVINIGKGPIQTFRVKLFTYSQELPNSGQPHFIDRRQSFLEPFHIRTHNNALITSPTTS